MRLIDADALQYSDARDMLPTGQYITREEIDKAAEPIRHGHWEYVKKRLVRGGYVDANKCSICHKIIMPHLKPNYCPSCGAKMDQEQEGEQWAD